jgi:hypothetical protein
VLNTNPLIAPLINGSPTSARTPVLDEIVTLVVEEGAIIGLPAIVVKVTVVVGSVDTVDGKNREGKAGTVCACMRRVRDEME